jgi:hypothetical protein
MKEYSIILCIILSAPNKNIKIILNYVVGPLVFCLLIYSIYVQIQRQPNWHHSLEHIGESFTGNSVWKLFVVILLMFINWAIEARKWQIALSSLQKISFVRAYKAIFTGTTMAFFTPNRVGEYLGRILYIKEGYRARSIALTIVCSIAQLLVTFVIGFFGLIFFRKMVGDGAENHSLLVGIEFLYYLVIAGCILLTIFYFRLSSLVRWLEQYSRMSRVLVYIRNLRDFNATILLRILSLSVFRYLVFIVQYYLLFQVFEVDVTWWQSFWSISVVFLVLAIVPSIAVLTELGIRWKASIELIRVFSDNAVGILATSLAIWVINLVIPALIGSLLILGIRIFRNKQSGR